MSVDTIARMLAMKALNSGGGSSPSDATAVYVNNILQKVINFKEDPQTQIDNILANSIQLKVIKQGWIDDLPNDFTGIKEYWFTSEWQKTPEAEFMFPSDLNTSAGFKLTLTGANSEQNEIGLVWTIISAYDSSMYIWGQNGISTSPSEIDGKPNWRKVAFTNELPEPTPSSIKTRFYTLPDYNGQKGIFGLNDIDFTNAFLVGFIFTFCQNNGNTYSSNFLYVDANYIKNYNWESSMPANGQSSALGIFDLYKEESDNTIKPIKAYSFLKITEQYGKGIFLGKIDYDDPTAGDININVDTMEIQAVVYYVDGTINPATVSQDDFNALKSQVESFINGAGDFYKTKAE